MSSRPSTFTLTKPGAQRLYSTEELIRMPPPTWQIDNIIPTGGLVGLYAAPGFGKTFVAIDMSLCIASGSPWMGFPVVQGYVLYISAEGGTGIGKRVQAWLHDRKVSPSDAPVAWLTEPVPVFPGSGGIDRLVERIENEVCTRPTLIVIDTLARCFDGDENQQEDMGRFVAGVDLLRTTFNATVLIVHHTRLDGERERGNTAFRGAADTMLNLDRSKGLLTLHCNKQKDAEEFGSIGMGLKVVPEFESCVISQPPQNTNKKSKADLILRVLQTPQTFDEALLSSRLSKTTFFRVLMELEKSGQIIKENDKWAIS